MSVPRTRVVSDGWKAYRDVDKTDAGIYQHDVVIHEVNFVDPFENKMWMREKHNLKDNLVHQMISFYRTWMSFRSEM